MVHAIGSQQYVSSGNTTDEQEQSAP